MPELPEVEVVRRGLAEHVVGRTFGEVRITGARVARRHAPGPADLADRLVGRHVTGVERRGKYVWLVLDEDEALVAHLGMSGQLLVETRGAPLEKHAHAVFDLAGDGESRQLRFVDQRTFGGLQLDDLVHAGERDVPTVVAHIAPDPLEAAFDRAGVIRRMKGKRTEVKRTLLDQTLVSGIGNIYADEALWRAQVHGRRGTGALTKPALGRLLGHAVDVMRAALGQGGTSFDALYVNVNGASGTLQEYADVQWVEGRPHRDGRVGPFCWSHLGKRPSRRVGSSVAGAVGLRPCVKLRPTARRRMPLQHAVPDIEQGWAVWISALEEAEHYRRAGLRMLRGEGNA